MKLFKTTAICLLLLVSYASHSQKLMQTERDLFKLKTDSSFKNKPLKELLAQIQPQIKWAIFSGARDHNAQPYLSLWFVDLKKDKKDSCAGGSSLRLYIYLNEQFNWSVKRQKISSWTEGDGERFGNYIIGWIRVLGQPVEDSYLL